MSHESLYHYTCRVVRVVDADTLDVIVDLGFGIALGQHDLIRLRLAGIDAPEMQTPEGRAAKEFAWRWVFNITGPGIVSDFAAVPFLLHTVKSKRAVETRDSIGRYLAHLYPLDGGKSLNDALVEAGHAARWST